LGTFTGNEPRPQQKEFYETLRKVILFPAQYTIILIIHIVLAGSCLAVENNLTLKKPMFNHSSELKQKLQSAYLAKGNDYEARTQHLNEQNKAIYLNRLILEDSPYLLQHAHNPVDWYP